MTINGHRLSPGEVMTLRSALEGFATELADPDALGDDEHGRAMTAAYRRHLGTIRELVHGARKRGRPFASAG